MKFQTALPLATALLILSGCSTMKVDSEYKQGYDFSKIKTYQWVNGPAKILDEDDTYINEDIKKILTTALTSRGWREVLKMDEADLQAAYYVKLAEHEEHTAPAKRDERDFSGGFVYNRDSSNWTYEEREPDLNIYTIEVGTLTVLVYDAKTGERVWRGNLKTRLDRSQSLEQQNERVFDAVDKLLSKLPTTAK